MVVTDKRLIEEVREFQMREIKLLQNGLYREWFQLFTDDLRYWMPAVSIRERREDVVSKEHELAYFDDNHQTLGLRVERVYSKLAWTESPPSRTRYFLQVLDIEPREQPDEVFVRSNFLIHQARLERDVNLFVGEREDVLRRVDGDWRIAFRKVVIDANVLAAKNLSIFF